MIFLLLGWDAVLGASETTQLITVLAGFAGTLGAAVFAFIQADRARRVTSSVESRKADQADFVLIRDSYKARLDEETAHRIELEHKVEAKEAQIQNCERQIEELRIDNRAKESETRTLERRIRVLENELKKVKPHDGSAD